LDTAWKFPVPKKYRVIFSPSGIFNNIKAFDDVALCVSGYVRWYGNCSRHSLHRKRAFLCTITYDNLAENIVKSKTDEGVRL
jgi:hypothetical protein